MTKEIATDSIEAVKARIALFCDLFDAEPPAVSADPARPDQPAMDDVFAAWLKRYPVNQSWLLSGDLKELLALDLSRNIKAQAFQEKAGDLDHTEAALFSMALKFVGELGGDVNKVFDIFEGHVIAARREVQAQQ